MLEIDGSQGEGGGQILRTSIALSAITQTPVRITNIRAGRKKSGLKRQHATAVQAAASLCDAETVGASPGSDRLEFVPGQIKSGDFRFAMGTAGSTSLVFQTLLPILLNADGPSTLVLEGGTHNPFAPPFDFLKQVYLRQLERMGASVVATIERHGFYPAGGGRVEFQISPCEGWKPVEILERGKVLQQRAVALVSNLPTSIGDRECEVARRKFGWKHEGSADVREVESNGPGNVAMIELEYQNVTELFIAFGAKGRASEQVARDVCRQANRYLKNTAPVGEYLADQLLLPMALGKVQGSGGGSFRTMKLTDHSTTHINIIREFLNVAIDVKEIASDQFDLSIT